MRSEVDFWNILETESGEVKGSERQKEDFDFVKSFKFKEILGSLPKSYESVKGLEKYNICSLCDFSTVAKGHLTRHKIKKHGFVPQTTLFSCESCSYTTKQPAHFSRHRNAKHEGLRFACDLCELTFSIKDSVRIHKIAVHQQVTYSCPACPFVGKRVDSLKYHFELKHSLETHKCEICHAQLKTKLRLKNHTLVEHGGVRHPCKLCEFTAKDSSSVKRHMREEHLNLRYFCGYCNRDFSHITTAKVHITSQHFGKSINNIRKEKKEKAFSCDYCKMRVTSKVKLNQHLGAQHADVLDVGHIHCKLCNFRTKLKSSMTHHKKMVHVIKPSTQFPCRFCEYVANTTFHLKRHKNLIHEKTFRRSKCSDCDLTFNLKSSLNKHVQSHRSIIKAEIKN